MSTYSDRLDQLSAKQRALVELLRVKKQASRGKAIQPLNRQSWRFPLSYSQQRLWFIDQLQPGNVAYNIPLGVRLRGRLDVAALRRSMDEIVRRHESLRTVFALDEG